ncbi:MAG: DUF952 domain-containing protein [Alphaproteobacteria bacterium]|nr:DUF952 domain-containing protein [Alphaproteobacteria bacterium]
MIYHLAKQQAWQAAQQSGIYRGLDADRGDGFLHFSTASQIVESARKHRAGEPDLVLLGVDEAPLGDDLVWEESRGGALFPHVYGTVPIEAVRLAAALPVDQNGLHVFPELPDDNEPA